MTWEFKPGMKVVCVNNKDIEINNIPVYGPAPHLVEGNIYTIQEILTERNGNLHVIVKEFTRVEALTPTQYKGYSVVRFRPLQTQFSSLLNSIVSGVNDGRLVVEDEKYIEKFKKSQRKKVSL